MPIAAQKYKENDWIKTDHMTLPLPRFHVPFWLSYILLYLFYFCPG